VFQWVVDVFHSRSELKVTNRPNSHFLYIHGNGKRKALHSNHLGPHAPSWVVCLAEATQTLDAWCNDAILKTEIWSNSEFGRGCTPRCMFKIYPGSGPGSDVAQPTAVAPCRRTRDDTLYEGAQHAPSGVLHQCAAQSYPPSRACMTLTT